MTLLSGIIIGMVIMFAIAFCTSFGNGGEPWP